VLAFANVVNLLHLETNGLLADDLCQLIGEFPDEQSCWMLLLRNGSRGSAWVSDALRF
jgi:hypothetical protein